MYNLHKFHYLVAHIFFLFLFHCAFLSVRMSMHTVWWFMQIFCSYTVWHLVTACLLFRPSGGVRHHEHELLFYICYILTQSCIIWTPLPCLYLSCKPSTYLFSPPFPSFPLRLSALIAKRWMSGDWAELAITCHLQGHVRKWPHVLHFPFSLNVFVSWEGLSAMQKELALPGMKVREDLRKKKKWIQRPVKEEDKSNYYLLVQELREFYWNYFLQALLNGSDWLCDNVQQEPQS